MNRRSCNRGNNGSVSGFCNTCPSGASADKLLKRIQEIDFSIYETVLYLDVYPDCREALAYYHSLLDARETLISEYEHRVGPLTMLGNKSAESWDWVKGPWPWQT